MNAELVQVNFFAVRGKCDTIPFVSFQRPSAQSSKMFAQLSVNPGFLAVLGRRQGFGSPALRFSTSIIFVLNEVGDVHRHLVDPSVVELLDVVKRPLVFVGHEVDGHALAAESATATNPTNKNKWL